jgi:replicative DNA helicase
VQASKIAEQRWERLGRGETTPRLNTGWPSVDRRCDGISPTDLVILGGRTGTGKAQPLRVMVLLANGTWRRMGDLMVGDALAAPDDEPAIIARWDQPSRVTHLFPQGMQPVFRVTFADGRSVDATGDHLWRVCSSHVGWRTMTTAQISAALTRVRHRGRLFVPLTAGQSGVEEMLPVHPYVLGALLGDGGLTDGGTPRFTTADADLVERMQQLLGGEIVMRPAGRYGYRLSQPHGAMRGRHPTARTNPLVVKLTTLGLWGAGSRSKFIPAAYLAASLQSRLELLRGLLDTDGTAGRTDGHVTFSSISVRLALGVQQLVWSLGGIATCKLRARPTFRGKDGTRRLGAPCYIVSIRHPAPESLFTLERKRVRVVGRGRRSSLKLGIVSVEPLGVEPCQCIRVSHPQGLYLTDNYVVTHNSTFLQQLCEQVARQDKWSLLCTPEMDNDEVIDRSLARTTGIDLSKIISGLSPTEHARIEKPTLPAGFFIYEDPMQTTRDIERVSRRYAAMGPLALIAVDYIQFLANKPYKGESRQQLVGRMTRDLRRLAKALRVPVIAGAQLGREAEKKEVPQLRHLRESGDLEQDAVQVWFLYFPKEGAIDGGEVFVRVAKNRQGKTGTATLRWNGALTRFDDPREDDGPPRDTRFAADEF